MDVPPEMASALFSQTANNSNAHLVKVNGGIAFNHCVRAGSPTHKAVPAACCDPTTESAIYQTQVAANASHCLVSSLRWPLLEDAMWMFQCEKDTEETEDTQMVELGAIETSPAQGVEMDICPFAQDHSLDDVDLEACVRNCLDDW